MSEHATLTTEQRRDARLQATYGITEQQYRQMEAAQHEVCAVCLRPPQPGTVLVVDHNHENGEVRGLLCGPCNTASGLLGDDPVRTEALKQYQILHGHYARADTIPGVGLPAVHQSHPDLAQASGPANAATPED